MILIDGFHRGISSWICTFSMEGRENRVAYLERSTGQWRWAGEEKFDPSTRSEIGILMSEKLKEKLKEWGAIPKSSMRGER